MREEAALIMETACYSVNNIPYGKDNEGLFICLNDVLMPFYQMPSLAEAKSPLANVNILIEKLKLYQERINKILRETLLTDWHRFAPGRIRINKSKKNVVPEENDLVLIPADSNHDIGRYAVVEKIISPQTIKCRFKDGSEAIKPTNLVVPLVANCLLD